jgi:peptidoglycan/LPS O-acetylase OafA/YrhL
VSLDNREPKLRYSFLDGIRGIAAIFVLTRHTGELFGFSLFHSYLAVDIFFLLSGFVIAHAYGEKLAVGRLTVREFMLVRLIRLYPVYLLSLCVCAVLALVAFYSGERTYFADGLQISSSILLALFYLPSYAPGTTELFPICGVYWSLAYELVANWLYGRLHHVLRSRRVAVATLASLGLVLTASALHYRTLDVGSTWGVLNVVTGVSRACFGILLGILLHRERSTLYCRVKASPWIAVAVVIAILTMPKLSGFADAVVDLSSIFVLFPLAVVIAARAKGTRFAPALEFLGSASYPLYAFHVPASRLVTMLSHNTARLYAPVSGLLFSAVLTILCYYIETRLDAPIRYRLSRILGPHRTRGQTMPPSSLSPTSERAQ